MGDTIMLSLNILDVKILMNQLLLKESFDHFFLCEATVKTGSSIYIDGTINEDFYNSDELEIMNGRRYAYWQEQRELIFSMIKGKKTPLAFKFVFVLPPDEQEKLLAKYHINIPPSNISGLFLNIHFDQGKLTCTSGTSLTIFTLDKSLEQAWESYIMEFFKKQEITFMEL